MSDIRYMKRALELARNGWGRTSPNPLVGAVIVKNDEIIGEGWHDFFGGPHAEINAIRDCAEKFGQDATKGADIYVTLEPCSHYGKTPPCSLALIENGFKKVIAALVDPNPRVAGRGIRMLQEAGIDTEVGMLQDEALALNDIFIKHIYKKSPLVLYKYAMTLDGKTASRTGDSKWISSSASREYVHRLRSRYASILVGVNTIIKDNPMLTARPLDVKAINPVRVIIDPWGRVPENAKVLEIDESSKTMIAVSKEVDKSKAELYKAKGAELITLEGEGCKLSLNQLLKELHSRNIDSVLVEGGGNTAAGFFEQNLIDKVAAFIAPIIVGGEAAVTPVMGTGYETIKAGHRLKNIKTTSIGHDVLVEGYVKLPWEEDEPCLPESLRK